MPSAFHHQNALFGSGYYEFHFQSCAFFVGRKHNEFSVEFSYSHCADRTVERYVRYHQRGRSRVDAEHVRFVLAVAWYYEGRHLRFRVEIIREKRPYWTVGKTGRENFLVACLALAFEESAGYFAGCVSSFTVVAAERHEFRRSLFRRRGLAARRNDDSVSQTYCDRAASLFGQHSGFKRYEFIAHLSF